MVSIDSELGQRVGKHLYELNLETPLVHNQARIRAVQQHTIGEAFTKILECMGLNLEDDSLKDTPNRVAKMYVDEIFYGLDYCNFPKCSQFKNKAAMDEMVCVKNISVRSVCEHHLVPFTGVAHIAYIPKDSIIGLSKFNRVVDFFCRRPQIQERLTEQITHAMAFILGTDDVAVYIEASHMCVKLRGIQDPHSTTVTSKLFGRFKAVPELRNEFLFTIKGG